jgi:hypothetical protein
MRVRGGQVIGAGSPKLERAALGCAARGPTSGGGSLSAGPFVVLRLFFREGPERVPGAPDDGRAVGESQRVELVPGAEPAISGA